MAAAGTRKYRHPAENTIYFNSLTNFLKVAYYISTDNNTPEEKERVNKRGREQSENGIVLRVVYFVKGKDIGDARREDGRES